MLKKLKILLVLICISFNGISQSSYKVTNYSFRQGLSNSSVYDLIKDSKGFLWIATEAGLNKFDGRKFSSYTVFSDNLPDNSIVGIAEISGGRIFCSTGSSGFFIFDPQTKRINRTNEKFNSFMFKSHDILFSNGKIYVRLLQNETILVFKEQNLEPSDTIVPGVPVTDFSIGTDGVLQLITKKGLMQWKNGVFLKNIQQPFHGKQATVYHCGKSYSYFTADENLYILNKSTGLIVDSVKYANQNIIIDKIVEENNKIWFCSNYPAGVFQYDLKSKKLTRFSSYFKGTGNTIASIVQDHENNIWVGTYSSGIYKISPSLFTSIPELSDKNIYNVAVSTKENIFVCAREGMSVLENQSESANITSVEHCGYIYSVIDAGKNTVVAASDYCHQISGRHFVSLHRRSLYKLNDTLFLAGTWSNDVELLKIKQDSIEVLRTIKLGNEKHNRINCFLIKNGFIWCGTDKGLFITDPYLSNTIKIRGAVFDQGIVDIIESHNVVYLATRIGLAQYYNGHLSFVKEINNHSIDRITSLCKDKNGDVFMSTLNGLFRLRGNGYNDYFDEEDGLSSDEIHRVVYSPVSNSLILATNEGLNVFDLRQFTYLEKYVPKMYFEKLTSNGSISFENGRYNLTSRNVNLFFGSVGYTHTSSVTYKWKLDEGAVNYSTNPSVEFASLPYGYHELEIYVSNDGSRWSAPYIVKLNIITPFYKTWMFYSLCSIIVLLLLYFSFKQRLQKIRRTAELKAEMEQKMTNLKHEALNASINPHFVFNALNSVQHYINTNRNDEASDYLARLAFLIRQTLENASAHYISIHEEVARLRMYLDLEKIRFNNGFDYEIIIDPAINTFNTYVPNMILQPLIENAIIHGFKQIDYMGFINLSFSTSGSELMICVDDNGRGMLPPGNLFQVNKDKKSIALANVKERIKTIKGAYLKITDKSFMEQGNGVKIEIRLPLLVN